LPNKTPTILKNSPSHDGTASGHVWRMPIRYKLAFPVLILVLGIVFFVLFTTFNVFRDMMVKYKEARLQTIAEIFSETLRIPLEAHDQRSLRAYIQLLAEQADVDEVRVEDEDGKTLGSSRPESEAFPVLFHKKDFFGVEKIDPDTYAAVAPIMSGEGTLGRLIIIFSKIEFEKELRKIFAEKFFVAFVLVILATLVIVWITWWIMRPLTLLQKTARNILAGDLEARANIHSRDEIQEVGEAFNKVVSRLVQSFDHLRARTQALEESEEKYRSIVNDVSDIIFSITPEGELMILNRGFSGYAREEILAEGLPLFFSMHAPGEAQKFQDALETIVRTKKPVEHLSTRQFHRLHHAEIYYQTNLTPVVDYEGNLRLIQGVMRDITDLRHVEMMKETLVRDVAHELKTPTAKFIMTTQWLARQMANHPEKEKFLPMINLLSENADRLMRTISSIMDLSKVESGMSDIKKQELDLNDALKLVAEDMRPLVEQHHLKLETRLSPSPLKMLGDPDMLYRVFVNLIMNATKFTPDGTITIASSIRGSDIFAEVADTGIGIEPENLQRIFEAFFQKTPSTLGIGVGLTISKEIVALHEGEIWAESEGAGQGSVFKVVFPSYQTGNRNA
jgi:two-component system, OmpR family, phosphate regulon sensor histidine kinase PhoR